MEKSQLVSRVVSALSALSLLVSAPALAENAAQPAAAGPVEWSIDAAHTYIGFSVPHMVVSDVEGQFRSYAGKVLLDEKDPTKSDVSFTVQVASIDTGVADRDKHLKSADFFDAEKYPTITFKSKKISKAGKGYKIKGDLTMRGVTKEVTLDATLSAAVVNPWGKAVRGVRLSGKLDRQAFGVSWNKSLDKGGVVVGDEVTVDIKTEINK